MLQVSLAGTGITISDGATTSMPIGPHKATRDAVLSPQQMDENRAVVHGAWKLHYDNIMHSMRHAYYQGTPASGGATKIRLGDIAEIRRDYADPPSTMVRHQGRQVVALGVSMARGGDMIALGRALDQAARRLQA